MLVSSEASFLGLQMAIFFLRLHVLPPLCILVSFCVPKFPLLIRTREIGLQLILTASLELNDLFKGISPSTVTF